jgi:DNA-binding CsgD family transcriptional regulator
VAGRAALGAGRVDAARSLLEPVVNAWLLAGDTTGWGYRWQIPRTIAVAMSGSIEEAGVALAVLEERRHPSWRCLDYERGLAQAWVAACRGAVSEAIATALSAAETANANGQFAAEVMCLQTATQFGDRSCAPRLRELEGVVEGPRACLATRFAESLCTNSAAELAGVSKDFEQMGDLVAAVDAAAYAAVFYRDQGMRGSALASAARSEALAQHCGGASTPALREAIEPLPLTDREREVVILLGQGLSNRDIAARLTLSVRTVEGHIYHAMAKTGTTTREDLAAVVPRRRPNPTVSDAS